MSGGGERAFEPRRVRCPGCGQQGEYSADNPFRPFCSERCRNTDFGAWASERYRVAAPPTQDDDDAGEAPSLQPPH